MVLRGPWADLPAGLMLRKHGAHPGKGADFLQDDRRDRFQSSELYFAPTPPHPTLPLSHNLLRKVGRVGSEGSRRQGESELQFRQQNSASKVRVSTNYVKSCGNRSQGKASPLWHFSRSFQSPPSTRYPNATLSQVFVFCSPSLIFRSDCNKTNLKTFPPLGKSVAEERFHNFRPVFLSVTG